MKFLNAIPVNTFYAYFDLKNANVFIYDGYKGPGGTFLVNNPGTSEVQTITFSGTIATGSYSLKFNGQTTSVLTTYTATDLQAALEALSTIGVGNVTVAGTAAVGPFTVTFAGKLAGMPQPLITQATNTLQTAIPAAVVITVTHATPGTFAYPAGTTTMVVDGGTGVLVVTDQFKLSTLNGTTDDNVYTITAVVGNPTTSVTFTPALSVGVQDEAVIAVQPHFLNVKLGDGNFTFTEKKPREYKKNRGFLDAVRNGDEDPLEVKLEFAWIFIKSSTGEAIMVEDALKQTGNASSWVTAGVDPCEPYCVLIRLYYVPPCPGVNNEIIDLAEFRYEELQHDAKTGMIACTAKCNLTSPTVTRVAKDAFNQTITH